MGNIRKCLAEPFNHIVLVAADAKKLATVNELLEAAFVEAERTRLKLCETDELFAFVEQLEAQRASTTKNVRGYKVRVNYAAADQDDRVAKRKTVAQVIARTMKRRRST
jgi:hypothetical protein